MITASEHCWIWPRASSRSADQSLCFKTSGVDRGDVHWSSQECFTIADELYQSMHWIFENRKTLPLLVIRERVDPDLAQQPPLKPLSDGVHVLVHNELIAGWAEALNLPVTVYTADDTPPSLVLLMRLTGANCFLFFRGACEAEASIGSEATDNQVTAEQILRFFKTIVLSPPSSQPSGSR